MPAFIFEKKERNPRQQHKSAQTLGRPLGAPTTGGRPGRLSGGGGGEGGRTGFGLPRRLSPPALPRTSDFSGGEKKRENGPRM